MVFPESKGTTPVFKPASKQYVTGIFTAATVGNDESYMYGICVSAVIRGKVYTCYAVCTAADARCRFCKVHGNACVNSIAGCNYWPVRRSRTTDCSIRSTGDRWRGSIHNTYRSTAGGSIAAI